MTAAPHAAFSVGIDPTRYWSLIFDGQVVPLTWDDGERLLALSTAIREGHQPEQEFRCLQRAAGGTALPVRLSLTPEFRFELITEYDRRRVAAPSHWFG